MNLRWLFLFLWFCQLTILILLYSGFNCFFLLNFWFIVVISLKVSRVKLIKDSGNSTSEVFLTFQMESVKVYILSIENHPPFFHLLILRKSRHALSFPRNMTKSGQFGSISNISFTAQQCWAILLESLLVYWFRFQLSLFHPPLDFSS